MVQLNVSLPAPQKQIIVTGPFDNWTQSIHMTPESIPGIETILYKATLPIEPTDTDQQVQYKLVIDGEWTLDPAAPTVTDGDGNTNNWVLVPAKNKTELKEEEESAELEKAEEPVRQTPVEKPSDGIVASSKQEVTEGAKPVEAVKQEAKPVEIPMQVEATKHEDDYKREAKAVETAKTTDAVNQELKPKAEIVKPVETIKQESKPVETPKLESSRTIQNASTPTETDAAKQETQPKEKKGLLHGLLKRLRRLFKTPE